MQVVLLKSRAKNQGGLEKAASRIAQAFVERGANVTILTTGMAAYPDPRIAVRQIQTASWPAFLRMEQFDRSVQKWLQKNRADLVFGMDRNRSQTHIRAGNGVHAAYLKSRLFSEGRLKYLTCLINPMHRKILSLEKSAFECPNVKKIFTNSRMVRDQILERFTTDPAKIQVIHNGVEWRDMQGDFDAWRECKTVKARSLDLDPHLFHFLFIGNGYQRKGLSQLLDALALLKRRDFILSVVGHDRHIAWYQAKAAQLKLGNQVHFFGPQKDIRSFYQIADVLVIPSFYDPFANVTVEALAMGLYVLSSRSNGGSEVLTEANGALIPNLLDPAGFAHCLEEAMKRKKTKQSAHLARESVQHLDFSRQLNTLIDACLPIT